MDNDVHWYSYLWNRLRNPGEENDSHNCSVSQEFASFKGLWMKICRWDGGSHPQSRRSKPTRLGMRAAVEHWRGWQNTFRPVITAPRQERIKREEDPPQWHLESLRAAALMNQTVSGLNTTAFWRLPSMLWMSEIIDALCKEKDSQQIWSATKNVMLPGVAPTEQPHDQRKWFSFPARPIDTKGGFLFHTRCKELEWNCEQAV